jgi:hypothetical protein
MGEETIEPADEHQGPPPLRYIVAYRLDGEDRLETALSGTQLRKDLVVRTSSNRQVVIDEVGLHPGRDGSEGKATGHLYQRP